MFHSYNYELCDVLNHYVQNEGLELLTSDTIKHTVISIRKKYNRQQPFQN